MWFAVQKASSTEKQAGAGSGLWYSQNSQEGKNEIQIYLWKKTKRILLLQGNRGRPAENLSLWRESKDKNALGQHHKSMQKERKVQMC